MSKQTKKLVWGGFCLCWETANAQNGRWQQLRNKLQQAIIYSLFPLPKRRSRRGWYILPTRENMASNNNNNRYMWDDEETKVFLNLIWRT